MTNELEALLGRIEDKLDRTADLSDEEIDERGEYWEGYDEALWVVRYWLWEVSG